MDQLFEAEIHIECYNIEIYYQNMDVYSYV